MFLKFYRGQANGEIAQEFAKAVLSFKKPVSPAQIQGYFMFYKQNTTDVVQNIEQIWTTL